jgi:putative aminopeptidase FrvX
MIDKIEQGDIKSGKGPVLTYGPAVHRKLLEKILSTAKENNIPFQRQAASRTTGTDTDAFAYANGGIPSALISLPIKYMHTTVEMAHRKDVENVILLILNTLKNIQKGENLKYFS